ncbi:MAG: hypothetical protein ACI9WC_000249 [Arenicella sp.]|jgi:hypothetical protein
MKLVKSDKLHRGTNIIFKFVTALLLLAIFQSLANGQDHYQIDSTISEQVTVSDEIGTELSLQKLIAASGAKLSVVFIFGGGAMGHQRADKSGGLWCPDWFEDMYILRSLHNHYKGKVSIIPVAVPPVYHSELLGYEKGLFFTDKTTSEYQQALTSFVDSTQSSFQHAIIPVQPFYDNDFNFLMSQQQIGLRGKLSPTKSWHGAFRAKNEKQHYGVPNLWIVDATGKVIAEPFRGNVYGRHGEGITINHTLKEVVAVIEEHL